MKLLILFLLLFPHVGNAYFNKAQKAELNRKIFKTEQHLKTVITRDLKLATGVKEVLVDIKIKVNKRRIYDEVASIDDNWQEIKDLQLPSMFIDTDQQTRLKEVKSIKVENVLGHIKALTLIISTPYDITNKTKLAEQVKFVLAANYNRFDKVKLKIDFRKEETLLEDNRDKSLSAPNYTKIFNDMKSYAPYLFTAAGVMGVIMLLFLFLFKGSMNKMAEAIDEVEVSGNLTASLTPPKEMSKELDTFNSNIDKGLTASGDATIATYIELVDKIRSLIKTNKELVFEMISLHFHLGEVNKILILLNILAPHDREEFYQTLPANHLKDLKSYVVHQADKLYQDEDKLNGIAQEIFRVISVAMVKPESFYQIYLKKVMSSLTAVEIANIIRACNPNELMYFLNNVDGVKLAFVTATNDLSDIDFYATTEELSCEDAKVFVHKLAKFIYVKDQRIEDNANTKIIPNLSDAMEIKYIESMGLSPDLTFKNLVYADLEFSQNYIKELSFEEICSFLALFSDDEREEFISILPTLVAERVVNQGVELNERTFSIKIDLYSQLKERYLIRQKENVQLLDSNLNSLEDHFSQGEEDQKLLVDQDANDAESDSDDSSEAESLIDKKGKDENDVA
ncbi:MAG: hypothetical protein HON90_01820 [Halobacteriovoraceae bacterium]|nr:hypothetical protein [Halobacteriovoraceae bacterium]